MNIGKLQSTVLFIGLSCEFRRFMPNLVKAPGLKTRFKVFFPQIIERKKTFWSQTGLGSNSGSAKYFPCDLAPVTLRLSGSLIGRMEMVLLPLTGDQHCPDSRAEHSAWHSELLSQQALC